MRNSRQEMLVSGSLIRTLVNEQVVQGVHSVEWDGKDNIGNAVASGIYFYRMQAGEFEQTRKMILLR